MKNPFKNKLVVLGVLFSSIVLISVVAIWLKKGQYSYVNPRHGEIVEAIYGMGKVKTNKKYDVKVGVLTHVQQIFVKEGDQIKKGAPMIQFNDSGVFRAPFDGTVTRVTFNVFDSVPPQAAALTIEDLSDKYIEVSLEQEGALRVEKGQSAEVIFESVRGEKFTGVVDAIFPKDDEFLAHIKVDSLQENVLPGMTADVSIEVGKHEKALLVPVAGLSNGQLIVKRDGKKIKVQVTVGGVDGDWAEITDGNILESDEVLIQNKKGILK